VVVFGEPIPDDVGERCAEEVGKTDCMVLIGTSAYVFPAAGFPRRVASHGGLLIEIGPHPTEISEVCENVVRGTAAEVLPQVARAVASRMSLEGTP